MHVSYKKHLEVDVASHYFNIYMLYQMNICASRHF